MLLSKRALMLSRQQTRSFGIFGNLFGSKDETAVEVKEGAAQQEDQNIEAQVIEKLD